jgi:hypothetical protein
LLWFFLLNLFELAAAPARNYHMHSAPHQYAQHPTMAKTKSSIDGSKHKGNSLSLRRSHRLQLQEPFRLEALPPELRSMIYILAVYHESQVVGPDEYKSNPRLGGRPGDTALVLSHVSRSVRADSMAAYYGGTTFLFVKWPSTPPLLPLVLRWARTWGVQAAPYIRSLIIKDHSLSPGCDEFRFNLNDTLNPLKYYPGDCSCLVKNLSAEDMNALVLTLLHPRGRLEVNSLRLLTLFRAIRGGASGFVSMNAVQKAAVIAELGNKVVEDREYWT